MKRELRTLIVIAVALVAGGVAAFLVSRQVSSIPSVREVEVGKATMVIAAYNLPLGTRLTRDNVRAVPWPSVTPIVGSFDAVEKVLDRGLIANVVANEPLTESKLAPTNAGSGLPPAIPKGMRAVSVRVNEVIGVAGFVVPGTRVDVLATVDEPGTGSKESMSRVVLSDVTVLASGTRYDQEGARAEGKPIPATVVTLLVTPQDAERVALASEKSHLMLALRNPLDIDPTQTTGIRMASLMGTTAPSETRQMTRRAVVAVAPPPPPPPPPPPARYTVEAIKGAKRTEEVLH
jgi:pilus assembly protein CpaB